MNKWILLLITMASSSTALSSESSYYRNNSYVCPTTNEDLRLRTKNRLSAQTLNFLSIDIEDTLSIKFDVESFQVQFTQDPQQSINLTGNCLNGTITEIVNVSIQYRQSEETICSISAAIKNSFNKSMKPTDKLELSSISEECLSQKKSK